MPGLVAVVAGGERLVEILHSAWAAGDAVLPVDPRLPPPAIEKLLDACAPGWLVDARAGGSASPLPRAGGQAVDEGDALVVATSGTTGEPKGVVLTHDAVAISATATSERLRVVASSDQWIACLPLAHVGGLSVVTRAFLTSTPCTVLDGCDAPAVEAAARTARASGRRVLVALVATALGRVDPALFDVIVLGGSAPPARVPTNAVVTYGMTETGSGVVYDGRALSGVEIRIEEGSQILLRAPMLGRAYRGPAGGEQPLVRDDGWFATGDAGHLTPDGRLVVDGRMNEVIVTGGEKVWPAAVERVLCRDPRVNAAAVVGIPDATWGTAVVAVVEPAAGGEAPALDELRALVKQELPGYAAPRHLVVIASMPRTTIGKVSRTDVRRLAARAGEGARA